MKTVKFFVMAALAGFAMTACNQAPEETTKEVEVEKVEVPAEDNTRTTEDDGSSIGVDVKRNEDGKVEGELEGDIKLD